MAERIDLTQATTTTLWRVVDVRLRRGVTWDGTVFVIDPTGSSIAVELLGDSGRAMRHRWTGATADTLIVALNKANLSGAGGSLEKRILNRLIADGIIAGTVAGSPD